MGSNPPSPAFGVRGVHVVLKKYAGIWGFGEAA
jgi:hypothetical protein